MNFLPTRTSFPASFFALSSDNYNKRSKEELKIIYDLISFFSNNSRIEKFIKQNKIKLEIKGDLERVEKKAEDKALFKKLKEKFDNLAKESADFKYKVNIALNYDGQEEIIHSFKKVIKKINQKELNLNEINEKVIKENLWFSNSSAPQIIVRTGDAPRLSGFMLWDSKYSEIFLTKKLWPELSETDFVQIIDWYKNVKRNFGA